LFSAIFRAALTLLTARVPQARAAANTTMANAASTRMAPPPEGMRLGLSAGQGRGLTLAAWSRPDLDSIAEEATQFA